MEMSDALLWARVCVCAFSLTVYKYTAMGWGFLDILVYSLLCGGLGQTVQHAVSLPSPRRRVTHGAVRLTLFTKRSTVARVLNAEFRLDPWLNRWNGSEPVHPPSVLLTSDTKCTLRPLCAGSVSFLAGGLDLLFLSISIVHSCLTILCATLYDAYFYLRCAVYWVVCFRCMFGLVSPLRLW